MSVTHALSIALLHISLHLANSVKRNSCGICSYWGPTNLCTTCLSQHGHPMMSNPDGEGYSSHSSAVVLYEPPILAQFHEESRRFTIGDHVITINQDWKSTGVAAVVWDAAVVLSEYLITKSSDLKDKVVLELGAGTGLAGIVAGKLGAQVILTDRGSVLENLRMNVDNNSAKCEYKPDVMELDWAYSDKTELPLPADIILGADIIYIEETFPLLLKTLELFALASTEVLLSCRIRYNKDSHFLEMLKEKFDVTEKLYDTDRGIYVFSASKKTQ